MDSKQYPFWRARKGKLADMLINLVQGWELRSLRCERRICNGKCQTREIVKHVAKMIGRQAQETSRYLKVDLATGKKLLKGGKLR